MSEEQREKQELQNFLKTHKNNMKTKYIFEGNKETDTDLKAVYTELFITEGEMEDVSHKHEILKIDDAFKNKKTDDKTIKCNDIFTEMRKKDKIVLTKGVAGIGKTVSVQKFILDWAEGEANQDIHCVFLLPFREINLMTNEDFSLHEFLLEFYPELKDLEKSKLYTECKLVFIFDGLDESRLPLNFNSRSLNTVEKKAPVDVLFTSLVKGKLLTSALVWVTSQPAAANQIPPKYVGLLTEVRGFTDQQKEEYFRKRITDESQAFRIISHIKTSHSLYIMCHIPVFCWITATVLQNILTENKENISTTLTEMYIHFLRIQMGMKSQKYDGKTETECAKLLHSNKEMILKLAELAFKQLKKETSVFYEEDLKECDIDVSKDTEFTGMIAEFFKRKHVHHKAKVFFFVHLSVQEFLAAVHVFLCYLNKNMQELQFFFKDSQTTVVQNLPFLFRKVKFHDLTIKAIDKAMQSKRGHLDLFVRFLMGISLESSQNLLKGLITHTEDTTKSITKITKYIKALHQQDISDEAVVNLFYCLLELKDHSLYEEIQSYPSSDEHPGRYLSSSMCTVQPTVLLMSEKVLDEFNPKKFTSRQADNKRFIPAVRGCRKALVDHGGESRIAAGLKKYYLRLSLDLNTVNKHLLLSQNNTVITNTLTVQQYPDHPDRFDEYQVLCRESVCGPCYWEIEWRGHVFISVSYNSISRKRGGVECGFGGKDQSWSLCCSPHSYSFRHNNKWYALSVKPIIIGRTGVFDDGFRRTREWIPEQELCPSSVSLTQRGSSTQSRPHSLRPSVLGFRRGGEFDDGFRRTGEFDDGFRRTREWIPEQELCPSSVSLTQRGSSTQSRPHSLNPSVLGFRRTGVSDDGFRRTGEFEVPCPSSASLIQRGSSTQSRPHSLGPSVLGFRRIGVSDDGFSRTGEFDDGFRRTGEFDDGFRRTREWIPEQELYPSSMSLTQRGSSTQSRPHSLRPSVLGFRRGGGFDDGFSRTGELYDGFRRTGVFEQPCPSASLIQRGSSTQSKPHLLRPSVLGFRGGGEFDDGFRRTGEFDYDYDYYYDYDDDDDDDFRRTGEFDGFGRTGEFDYDDDYDDDFRRTGEFDGFRRTGVFVDPGAGTLSFFSVSDKTRLIHTVQTTFTQALCPGFTVWSGSSVKLC